MYIYCNSGYDRARNLYKLMKGANPQDLVVKPVLKTVKTQKPQGNEASLKSGLMVSIRNIFNIISRRKTE